MNVLVTGCAGFIGSKVAELLLDDGHAVTGVDCINEAYDVRLKEWRLGRLHERPGFSFRKLDITDRPAVAGLFETPPKHRTPSPQSSPARGEGGHSGATTHDPQPTTDGFAAVINLAARAGVRQSVENPGLYYDANLTGTLNLLEACRKHGITRFVLASTSSLYGNPGENPPSPPFAKGGSSYPLPSAGEGWGEDSPFDKGGADEVSPFDKGGSRGISVGLRRPFSETDDTSRPLSPYAASKKAAETLCYSYHHLHGLDVTVLRYFTVYGPAGRPDMSVFRFIKWIAEGERLTLYGDGAQERDFTYVDDIARGTVAALTRLLETRPTTHNPQPTTYEVFNLGSDRPVALSRVIEILEELLGRKAIIARRPMHAADVMATWADINRARTLLGWAPETSLEEGLAAAVAWYQAERSWAREVSCD